MSLRYLYLFLLIFGLSTDAIIDVFTMEQPAAASEKTALSGALERLTIGPQVPYKAAIFFDWDNTLMASFDVKRYTDGWCETPLEQLPADLQNKFIEIDKIVVQMIQAARAAGAVIYIVTGAAPAWVHLTGRTYLPNMYKLLFGENLPPIHSNQPPLFSVYQRPGGKQTVFQHEIGHLLVGHGQIGKPFSVISFSDDERDRVAFLAACKGFHNIYVKSVKFVAHSTANLLKRQLEMIMHNLSFLIFNEGNLDLQLIINTVPSQQSSSQSQKSTTSLPKHQLG